MHRFEDASEEVIHADAAHRRCEATCGLKSSVLLVLSWVPIAKYTGSAWQSYGGETSHQSTRLEVEDHVAPRLSSGEGVRFEGVRLGMSLCVRSISPMGPSSAFTPSLSS